jgi:hypothetical protein
MTSEDESMAEASITREWEEGSVLTVGRFHGFHAWNFARPRVADSGWVDELTSFSAV